MTQLIASPPATKRVFRVDVCSTEHLWILVEATSPEEACKLARNIDAGYFHPNWPDTDWKVVDAKLASDYHPDQVAPPEAYDSVWPLSVAAIPYFVLFTTMNQDAKDRAEALRLVLSQHQMFPPSSDEAFQVIEDVLPFIRAKHRGIQPREDQTSIL